MKQSENSIKSDERKGVQSVERAFEILKIFEQSNGPLSVKEVATATQMTVSQVHHYLASLI